MADLTLVYNVPLHKKRAYVTIGFMQCLYSSLRTLICKEEGVKTYHHKNFKNGWVFFTFHYTDVFVSYMEYHIGSFQTHL